MVNLNNSPVSLEEFKQHLRIFHDMQDSNLTTMLLAAVGSVEKFTGVDFAVDYKDNVPYQLKAAILLTAGRLFENPTDAMDGIPTVAQNLIRDFRWEK
ncbi:head-tail connector protein [Parabacteroides sp. AM08-6]|uniref:head-tail connector protein n=1 Tax=Parabacteroides sp. AM08-6 TaxID=2292053 RepID=UPI000EFFBBC0|nr:head-tail connector protein [Parabacteroides sp. AM08-6]RHJ76226.1 phage gp6-like head-tail connector protein [Parabacteroides sp. AM08-6]